MFAAVTLASSKLWLRLDGLGKDGPLDRFPEQSVFLSIGPWMNLGMYLLQGAIVCATGAWLAFAVRSGGEGGRPAEHGSAPPRG
jgi:hypothetical protein